MNRIKSLVTLAALATLVTAPLAAQRTWIVDALGGPGSQFTDIPPAVAAASNGDRILVRGPAMGIAYSAFTTDKGITVVGRNRPLLSTASRPVTVANLPSGHAFAMVGFDSPRPQLLRIDLNACQGTVHLEDLHAVEWPAFFPTGTAAITIRDCDLVTMLEVESFGDPVVDASASTVLMTSCRFGNTSLNIGGGQALLARGSVIAAIEPRFEVSFPGADAAIGLRHSILELGGSTAAYVQGATAPPGGQPAPAIHGVASLVVRDPAVRLNPFHSAPQAITGSVLASTRTVPATWASGGSPGSTLVMTHKASPGDTLFALLGLPQQPPLASSIGTLLVDPTPLAVLAVAAVPPSGLVTVNLAVPAGFPTGDAFTAQGVLLRAGAIELTHASPFVVH